MSVNGENTETLRDLKRKRARERTNITRFVNAIDEFDENTPSDECNYHRNRLDETLIQLTKLDDAIHTHLPDEEYDVDAVACEEYIDKAKKAIHKVSRRIENTLCSATTGLTINQATHTSIPLPPTHSIKLPPVKLEPFSGDIETWMRFWEQFQSSIDHDPSLSVIHKHVFLRGYLEGEPKMLVDGIAITASTYEDTKRILLARYGNKDRIIQAHIDYLEDIKPIRFVSPETLNATYIECNRRIHALTALGENVNNYGRVLAPKLLRAFPDDICTRWLIHAKRNNIPEGDIIKLMEFLGDEVDGALVTQKIRGESFSPASISPTTATLQIHSKSEKSYRHKGPTDPFCAFCEQRGHWGQDCKTISNVYARIEKLKASKRCFLCLNRNHNAKNCSKKGRAYCSRCKGSHHRAICDHTSNTAHRNSNATTSVGKISVIPAGFTHLQTARIWVVSPSGALKPTRCVLDAGSQSSFITTSLIDELGLEIIGRQTLAVSTFETSSATSSPRRLVRLAVKGFWNNTHVNLTAFDSDHLISSQPTAPSNITSLGLNKKLKLADPTDNSSDLPIELLIGGDQYWKIVKDAAPIRLSTSMVLLPSIFGWIFSGSRSGIAVSHYAVNFIDTYQLTSLGDDVLRRFWDLETLGITNDRDRTISAADAVTMEEFHASYCLEDQRRVVRLPKKGNITLPSNYGNAEKRFHSLEQRMQRNESFKKIYEEQMTNYIRRGHVELAPPEKTDYTFYLPHHLVKKQKLGHIKWRVVFDASSHPENAPSLNDILKVGPNLLPEILALLIRFRMHRFALVGDIVQAFLQLTLQHDDRDMTRFLWYHVVDSGTGDLVTTRERTVYRFKRLPFGLTCSPFLLSATLRELADRHKLQFSAAASLINENTFMDDFAAGAPDETNVISLYYELVGLMKQIKLPMSKWATNSQQLNDLWQVEGRDLTTETQVLGVTWQTSKDTLSMNQDIGFNATANPATKRHLLHITASFYDPLGLLTPVSIVGKVLFQDTWSRGIGWDELLPHDLATRWYTWITELTELSRITIPRWIGSTGQQPYQIHVFCDASERAYGAALYSRYKISDAPTIHLVCSKARLAPVKKVTLPRLELLAALVGVRLLDYTCKAASLDIRNAMLWTDAQVVLGWIRNEPTRWKTFVCNRVTEIQTFTSPSQWRHCPGKDNPADHLTRGLMVHTLVNHSTWWTGPSWLSKDASHWPSDSPIITPLHESRASVKQVFTVASTEPIIDATRFSSYIKLLRVTAWVHRLSRILRHRDHPHSDLIAEELTEAREYWIKRVQMECFPTELHALQNQDSLPKRATLKCFNPFLDKGIIRLGGRLQCSGLSHEQRHPIILDGEHHFTRLMIHHTHVRLQHLGVRIVLGELRQTFWILRARRSIKKVLHKCLPCKIAKQGGGQEIEAPLPAQRVTQQKPFAVSGIDFAGPLYVKSWRTVQKSYIALFTCASTRALHLELCSDMTTERFLQAFKRFVGRRGIPHTIYSDNAQTFHSANRELIHLWAALSATETAQYMALQGISWKFIAPRAAWWGGWWERMIGSTKRCLRKVLGRSTVDDEELRTVLIGIEAALNSRPLTQDEDNGDVLTPAHFLVGGRLTTLPSGPEPPRDILAKTYRRRQQMEDHFWKRWSKEYLLLLQSFHQVRQPTRMTKLRVGDVVLLQEDVRPRHMWRKARIQALRPGRDGRIRTVIIRTPEGKELSRPLQLVIPLEVDQGGEDVGD